MNTYLFTIDVCAIAESQEDAIKKICEDHFCQPDDLTFIEVQE